MDTTQPVIQSQPTPALQTPAKTPLKEKKKRLPMILLFIGIVILVAAIAFGVMFLFMKSQQKISFAPPFPETSPIPSATPTSLPEATSSPTAKLTPTTAATPSATPAP